MRVPIILFMILLSVLEGWAQTTPTLPTLPQAFVSTTRPVRTGTTCTGANLSAVQACLNTAAALTSANGGNNVNEVVITAGSAFTGPLTLPARGSGATGWILLRSSLSGNLPENTRVAPSSTANMARVNTDCSGYTRGIQTRGNAHHYWLIGIEVVSACTTAGTSWWLIDFGGDDLANEHGSSEPGHHFVVDRSYLHGTSTSTKVKVGVALNAYQGYGAVLDSYISEIHEQGADSQAVWALYNPGPILVQNNYLEAGGENFMSGGSFSSALDTVARLPSDITLVRNTIAKPIVWKALSGLGPFKALVEFKTGKRILMEGNILSGSWLGCASCEVGGFSLRLTVRSDEGGVPFAVLQDVTIRYNRITDVTGMYNLTSSDGVASSGVSSRIHVHNNLWYNFSTTPNSYWDQVYGSGINGPGSDWTIEHNTVISAGSSEGALVMVMGAGSVLRYSMRNNIIRNHPTYDLVVQCECPGQTTGSTALDTAFGSNGWFYDHNVIMRTGGALSGYPAGNFWPTSWTAVQFVNLAGDNYRLAAGSPYKNAGSDGLDIGANIDAMEAAIAGGAPPVDTTPPAVPTGVYITRSYGTH